MALPIPNLDDRDFDRLLADAKALIAARSPEWTDLSPSDPGMTLLEVFAYLTDTLLYRVNRIPEKAFVQFLELIGVRVLPPAAASVDLVFSLPAPATADVVVPRGSRVSTARSDADSPVFSTAADARIAIGAQSVIVRAFAGDVVDGEELGTGTGKPGQTLHVAHPPITLPTGDVFDLVIGVQAAPGELANREPARESDGLPYRIWTEVEHFGAPPPQGAETHLYTVDRAEGVITFAPAAQIADPTTGELTTQPLALAEVPAPGRRILAWYRHGGGANGNVAAGTLTVLKDAVPGVTVTNPAAATGGRDRETLENAMIRGPQSIHTLDRVVTARDYEQFAVAASGGVSRARAVTRADAWVGAAPGEVQVYVVPTADVTGGVGADALDAAMSPQVLERLAEALHSRQPIGTRVRVSWAGFKRTKVRASVVVHRTEDRAAIERRLRERLDRVLSPVPVGSEPGWPFGEYLRVARVYDVLQSERGVRYVSGVTLLVEDVPGIVPSIVRDPNQRRTWFCGSGEKVFRSIDDAAGWVAVCRFEGESVERLAVLPAAPGCVVAVARVGETESSVVHASTDYGETWVRVREFDSHVEELVLARIDGQPHAFLATDAGLFRLPLQEGAVGDHILVVAEEPGVGFYAVSTSVDPSGALCVAAAAQELKGVFVSFAEGRPGTFVQAGLSGVDIRVLRTLEIANRRYLYAGAYATGTEEGVGVSRVEVLGVQLDAKGWEPAGAKWAGGSCRDIAFIGETVLAATERAGVAVANPRQDGGAWRTPTRDCGLPLRQDGTFQALFTVAANESSPPLALCGGPDGIFHSSDGRTWGLASRATFDSEVSLPPDWLFAPGAHEITVGYDDAL
ncbi:putative baseplate assembly protein [Microbacterium jiangjiandongii]|uniref:putative baseplate assembly protein n=1 Tax=Microbacterium jiangjiandongii TaxID=3049071 RepID=UPI00214C8F06|nr:putative baseplate assembly protein [Microbacterium sp. zg.Y843]MCR2815097.1 putative baseplate assembly protein [Microbacterium sp. zg.Y843]